MGLLFAAEDSLSPAEFSAVVAPATPISGFHEDCDDGYETPTSEDHRIPAPRECPPAPRKRRALRGEDAASRIPVTAKKLFARRRTAILVKAIDLEFPEFRSVKGAGKIEKRLED